MPTKSTNTTAKSRPVTLKHLAAALAEEHQLTKRAREGSAARRPQAVDLHEFQDVDVVLVPLDDLAVDHRRRLDRHKFVEAITRQYEPAGMLREMARRADQFAGEFKSEPQTPVAKIQIEFFGVFRLNAFGAPAPDLRRQHLDEVFGKTERLPDIP